MNQHARVYHPPRLVWDALIGRLSYDEDFKAELVKDPRGVFEREGLVLDKEQVDAFIHTNPEVFEKMSKALLKSLGLEFFAALGAMASTCDPVNDNPKRR